MKTLKFTPPLVQQIQTGVKRTTWRLFDEKDLQAGNQVHLINKETDEAFGTAELTEVRVKTLGTLTDDDWEDHERFASDEEMYATYQRYYGPAVGPGTEVKIVKFTFDPKVFSPITVVDEQDTVLGTMGLREAKRNGCIRRIARVFVFNHLGQVLLQQRGEQVADPGLLDASAAGHVDEGETYEVAAVREFTEELGLSVEKLEEMVVSLRSLDCMVGIYRTLVPNDTNFTIDPEEVATVSWWSKDELAAEIERAPERFTPYFLDTWPQLRDEWWPYSA